ncbi:GDSL-like lipase/acylhydrolase family protein [Pontibacter ummariensis]|uniref:GDSL-like Lipase/Acylhydrolase n=1 Tax=Pontibacter ummariensis TaxID=1610492 RepID=A0A239CTL4_9BACT|nr:SGNH/GDSL hydrolase family protein [Pontibacter ummariensis]PRY14861.1 GDSL-like lipase/acylhydrolase family protein [Pontibacter ummariensis]SNS22864.1 GDSL-like Lipase/Acylhydrolase [Pontibacter ummariensis]
MKKYIYKVSVLALFGSVLFTSCEPEVDYEVNPSAGEELDFSNYVAVGNSLTAGFQDGGLYLEGQLYSYPAILADQFEEVGGGEFVQPLFTAAQRNGSGYLRLAALPTPTSPVTERVTDNLAVRTDVPPLPGGPRLTKFTQPVNNLAVPGMSVLSSYSTQYGAINPYFERLLPDAEVGTKSYLQRVAEADPTFFTLWLGNNDILTYATNGAVADPANPLSDKTPVVSFKTIYSLLVNELTDGGEVEGVIANIPDVTAVPFFNTVTLAAIRQGAGAPDLKVYIKVGPAPSDVRELTADDLVLLSAKANIGRPDQVQTPNGPVVIPHGFNPANPLNDNEVLDKDEVVEVKNHTKLLNDAIAEIAAANNIPVFDVNAFFNSIKGGFKIDEVTYSPAFISGNLFSLDGIHLTPRGYAIIANEFIRVANEYYNASIPTVDVTQYRTVVFPNNN